MRYSIKARLAELGKKNVDVIEEINRRGVNCCAPQFSDAINGRKKTETADLMCEMANDIISEWEKAKKRNS